MAESALPKEQELANALTLYLSVRSQSFAFKTPAYFECATTAGSLILDVNFNNGDYLSGFTSELYSLGIIARPEDRANRGKQQFTIEIANQPDIDTSIRRIQSETFTLQQEKIIEKFGQIKDILNDAATVTKVFPDKVTGLRSVVHANQEELSQRMDTLFPNMSVQVSGSEPESEETIRNRQAYEEQTGILMEYKNAAIALGDGEDVDGSVTALQDKAAGMLAELSTAISDAYVFHLLKSTGLEKAEGLKQRWRECVVQSQAAAPTVEGAIAHAGGLNAGQNKDQQQGAGGLG